MALEASLHDSPESTWLGSERYGYCKDPVVPSASMTPTTSAGLSIHGCGGADPGSLYLGAFSWSLMVITGTGGTDYYPSSISQGETIIVMTLVLVGALIWTQVLAMFCDVATNADPGVVEFRQRLDSMNSYIRTNNLPAGMARRMREYLHQTQEMKLREFHAASVLPLLSDALQIEVVMHVNKHWLSRISFLKGAEDLILVRLAMLMTSRTFTTGEVAVKGYLYVVMRGIVLFGGRVLTAGMWWGDDVLLYDESYFSPHSACAMSYVSALRISKQDLTSVISKFPAAQCKVRRFTILLAMRRHLINQARLVKESEGLTDSSIKHLKFKGARLHGGDFIDRAHEAAVRKHNLSGGMADEIPVASGPLGGAVQPLGEELKAEFKSLHDEIHELRTTISALTQREDKLQQTMEALAALVASALKVVVVDS